MKIAKSDLAIVTKWIGDAIWVGNPVSSSAAIVFVGLQARHLIRSPLFWGFVLLIPLAIFDKNVIRVVTAASVILYFQQAIISRRNILSKWSTVIVLVLSYAAILGTANSGFYVRIFSGPKYRFVFNDANNYAVYALGLLCFLLYKWQQNQNLLQKSIVVIGALGVFATIVLSQSRMYLGAAIVAFALFSIGIKRISWLIGAAASLFAFGSAFGFGRFADTSLSGRDIIWFAAFEFIRSNLTTILVIPMSGQFEAKFASEYMFGGGHSLCENSYLAVLLCGGGILAGLFAILLIYVLISLWLAKLYRTSLLFLAIMAVWFFDDSLIYPISNFFQLFGVYCLSLNERSHDG